MVDAWKRYDVERWNDPPVGQPGSPVRTGFKQWYGINLRPQDFSVKTKDERLDAKATLFDSDALAIDKVEPAATVYRWLKFPDANVHKIDVHPNTTKAAGAGFVIQAFLKLADGTWRIEDWTSRDDVQLCRDRAAENVQEIVLAYADATTQGAALPNVRGTVQLARTCGLPARLDGTFTRVYTAPSTMGTWKETINGNVSFVRDPTFPLEADQLSSVDYKLAAGTITWSLSGSYDNGTCVHTYGGVGSEAATDATSFGTPTRITLENVVGHPGAPDPEPMPYYYSIREGQDPLKDPEGTDSGCGPTEAQPLILPYFDEGYANPIAPGFPADQVQKSATPKLLSGTRSAPHPDVSGVVFTDSWNFVGSG
jgi:hypothetical protein